MDTLCGLGLPEIMIIILLAFVLIGPERTQGVALSAGKMLRKVVRSDWWKEVNEITRAMKDLPTTLVRMADIEETQQELRETMREINDISRAEVQGARSDLRKVARDISETAGKELDQVQKKIDELKADRPQDPPAEGAEG